MCIDSISYNYYIDKLFIGIELIQISSNEIYLNILIYDNILFI